MWVACPERHLQKTTFYHRHHHQDRSEPLRMHLFFSCLLAAVLPEGCQSLQAELVVVVGDRDHGPYHHPCEYVEHYC